MDNQKRRDHILVTWNSLTSLSEESLASEESESSELLGDFSLLECFPAVPSLARETRRFLEGTADLGSCNKYIGPWKSRENHKY